MLKALAQYGDAGFPIAPAVQEASEAGDPMHGLTQGRRRWRQRRSILNGTVKSLPFLGFQQSRTRYVGQGAAEHSGIKDTPGDHAVDSQTAVQAIGALQLARFNAAATLEYL